MKTPKSIQMKFSLFLLPLLAGVILPLNSQAAPLQLKVSGNKIVNSAGCTVRLKGVNLTGLEYGNGIYSGTPVTVTYTGTIVSTDMPPGGILVAAAQAVTGWHCTVRSAERRVGK